MLIVSCDSSNTGNSGILEKMPLVAHAGGGIDGATYTNSFPALNFNLDKGFELFEIDLTYTSDGRLVCLHDWSKDVKRSFSTKPEGQMTLSRFEFLNESARHKKCTLPTLFDWLKENSTALIVTDIKGGNLKALKRIKELFGDSINRVIPQIYQPENYEHVRSLGYTDVIWTLYKYSGNNDQVVEWMRTFRDVRAVTMPKSRAKTGLPSQLRSLDIPTYVHTVNSEDEANDLRLNHKVSGVYTDFLTP